jgi:hypothetical protein
MDVLKAWAAAGAAVPYPRLQPVHIIVTVRDMGIAGRQVKKGSWVQSWLIETQAA